MLPWQGVNSDHQRAKPLRNDLRRPVLDVVATLRRACVVACISTPLHAGTAIDECADNSPTQAALSACLDHLLAAAERDLSAQAKRARQSAQAIRNRHQRAAAMRALDRAQKRFFASRDQECGSKHLDVAAESERGNRIRDCMVQMTRERAAQLAGSLPAEAAQTPAPDEARPSPRQSARPQADPVYGVDWRLMRLIRDNKEVALPPQYRANLRLEIDGRVSGFGAASAFTGRYRLRTPGNIEWAENGFLITRDARQPDPTQMDSLYVDSLERTNRAGLSKTGLVLRNEDGSISLSFER